MTHKKTNPELVDEAIERAKADPNCGRVTQEHLDRSQSYLERVIEQNPELASGGRLTKEQSDRFVELANQAPPLEDVPATKDPNFVPDPKACPLCKKRGKTWMGADPDCAFMTGEFDPDNWNCATMNALRGLEELPQARRWCCDDQSLLVFPLEGEFLILSWYKNRGRTDGAWTLYSDLIEPLSLEAAERILRDNANDKED